MDAPAMPMPVGDDFGALAQKRLRRPHIDRQRREVVAAPKVQREHRKTRIRQL